MRADVSRKKKKQERSNEKKAARRHVGTGFNLRRPRRSSGGVFAHMNQFQCDVKEPGGGEKKKIMILLHRYDQYFHK